MGPRKGLFLPLIEYYAGLRDSPVRQSPMPLMGQREPTAQMLCARKGHTRGAIHPEYYMGPCNYLTQQTPCS